MIALNAAILDTRPSGLGVFAREIGRALASSSDLVVFTSCPEAFPGARVEAAPGWTRSRGGRLGGLPRFLWTQLALPRRLRALGAELVVSPNHELVLFPPCEQAAVIYDLLPLLYPDNYPKLRYYFRWVLPRLLRRTKLVVAGSENTKRDLIRHYGLEPGRVTVIYAGVDHSYFRPQPRRPGVEPYVLTVGNQYPYKNLHGLLDAFAAVAGAGLPHKLILAGRKDPAHFPELEASARQLGLSSRVEFRDYIPAAELPRLYSEADLYVFPSLYEGFGLPALEAMACGAPVAASSSSSLPEACGDAAAYFDPADSDDMGRRLVELLKDPAERERLREAGLARARRFTWEASREAYQRLLSARETREAVAA